MQSFSKDDLEQLYQSCRQGASENAATLTLEQLLLHPASRDRAQAACRAVTRRCSRGSDLRDDVLHEASVVLGRRLALGRLKFAAAGSDAFGCWLWSIWHCACRDAWRRYCRMRSRELSDADLLRIEVPPRPPRDERRCKQVASALERIADPQLRAVLLDLAAGLSLRESAERRGISKSTAARLRTIGLEKIRAEFEKNEESDAARRYGKSAIQK